EDGVTANDANDGDSGANNQQNFPVLTSAIAGGSSTYFTGTLNSGANATYFVDFYANAQCPGSGFREGGRYLGAGVVTTVGNDGTFQITVPGASTASEFFSATATDSAGNTSEF